MNLHDDIRQRLLDLDIEILEDTRDKNLATWAEESAKATLDDLEDILYDAELDRKYADLAETVGRLTGRIMVEPDFGETLR